MAAVARPGKSSHIIPTSLIEGFLKKNNTIFIVYFHKVMGVWIHIYNENQVWLCSIKFVVFEPLIYEL